MDMTMIPPWMSNLDDEDDFDTAIILISEYRKQLKQGE